MEKVAQAVGPLRPSLRAYVFRRQTIIAFGIILLFLLTSGIVSHSKSKPPPKKEKLRPASEPKLPSLQEERLHSDPLPPGELDKLHLLLTSSSDVSMCKTLLSASVLGYPTPTLISWNQTFQHEHLIGNGRYLTKISGILDWLDEQPETSDDHIVLVVDSYGAFNYFDEPASVDAYLQGESWFQLRPETLLRRFHAVNAQANIDLKERLGQAATKEKIQQTILFGAGKRCAPNRAHSVACYPIPASPLPDDLYGPNTDTVAGSTRFSSYRQRYLNAGYIVGPVGDMRAMFRRAWEKGSTFTNDQAHLTGSTYQLNPLHRGSDQAIFQEIWGEQEFQREVLRRRHLSLSAKYKGVSSGKPLLIEGTVITDPLDPSFSHEAAKPKSGRPDEFGIGVDYWSDLGHQTVDAVPDGRFLTYNRPIKEQTAVQRQALDCSPRVTGSLPADILNTTLPRTALSDASQFSPLHGWDEISLYTHVCLDSIPAIVQYNGEGSHAAWPRMWMQPHARLLVEEMQARGGEHGGAFDTTGTLHEWVDLCPSSMEEDLYREADT